MSDQAAASTLHDLARAIVVDLVKEGAIPSDANAFTARVIIVERALTRLLTPARPPRRDPRGPHQHFSR